MSPHFLPIPQNCPFGLLRLAILDIWTPWLVSKWFSFFSFIFILDESLKNHSKSQNIIKQKYQFLDITFYIFLWFTIIFQIFIQNKHKRKRGKPLRKLVEEVICLVSRVEEPKYSIFEFQGENLNSGHSPKR